METKIHISESFPVEEKPKAELAENKSNDDVKNPSKVLNTLASTTLKTLSTTEEVYINMNVHTTC